MTAEATAETAAARPRVPVWRTVVTAYRDTFANFGAFLKIAALPLLLGIGVAVVLPESETDPASHLLNIALATLLAVIFELSWYRFLLFGGAQSEVRLLPPWNARFRRFLGFSFLLLLPTAPAELFLLVLGSREGEALATLYALAVLMYVTGIYFGLRLTFALLWIAGDAPGRLAESWRSTRGNGLRLLLIFILVVLPPFLLLFALGIVIAIVNPEVAAQFEAGDYEGWLYWVDVITTQVLLFVFYAIVCAALTRSFASLTGWIGDRAELLERFE